MRLIYVSPLPWFSFAQRPHKFVEWFHKRTGGEVLWVDPYPTRLPRFGDFRRPKSDTKKIGALPKWLTVLQPSSIPVEPLPGSAFLNGFLWQEGIREIIRFSKNRQVLLVIGKPSVFALSLLGRLNVYRSVYDAMDDFPVFYKGLSKYMMARREQDLLERVDVVWGSSSELKSRLEGIRSDVKLVHNGLDVGVLPDPNIRQQKNPVPSYVFGYVGTIASWFDWGWIKHLAKLRVGDVVRIIGPVYQLPSGKLPSNIEILPPCDHHVAMAAMQGFDVGLIPFRLNQLTASVDPIKYYEYRALGLPVISTSFGEMPHHGKDTGLFQSAGLFDVGEQAQRALSHQTDISWMHDFIDRNAWDVRFDITGLLNE
ncbi:glycosyl transferase [Prosthecochloris sp. CIB 2401]|uniref:glycosyl transferase n=1 Tax=Prosthecochloris sp. CIB 2401 TaxID=1868325 RepID=UPI00080ABA77|nr:glycosyl transferase [Prosthecochloris sp. CIB 2401]ANT64132.1 Putative teichuronic acid biosynthesis glycosyltransferase TuaH [Prosthecochloris sp. CIB 2401]